MLSQITKQISENISQSLAKHAPSQNLGQNLSRQNLASQAAQIKASQTLAPQTQARQTLTRFGNELATNTQRKPTQAVFDFDFIARDKTPELESTHPLTPSAAGGGINTPAQNQINKDEVLQKLQHLPNAQEAPSHTPQTQAQNLAPHTPQAQPLQARFDELKDFASKIATHTENLSHEAKSLYDSFAKSLESLSPETLSAKELNKADRNLAEYLANTELAQVSNAQEIILPYFSAKYRAKTEAELAQTFGNEKLAQMRQALQEAKGTNPLSEFGTNYAEFYQDGKGAIKKLTSEANAAKQAGQDFNGQVAGAFSKEIDGAMGSIDLVWGKITNAQTHEGYGLAHIIDKHPELDLSLIPQIIERGKIVENAGTKTIIYKTDSSELRVGLSKGFLGKGDNEWIITAYEKATPAQNFDQVASKVQSGNNLPTSGDNQIIQKISKKFNKDEKYAKNLYEWHKNSHSFTKEADGTPKVFYHGNKDNNMGFEIFEPYYSPDTSKKAVFFSTDKSVAQTYIKKYRLDDKNIKKAKVFEVFLKIKNPLVIDFEGEKYAFVSQQKMADKVFKGEVYFDLAVDKALERGKHDGIIFKNIKDNRYGAGDKIADTFIVFDSNQIKAVGNKGTFEATNPNIYHSSSTAGGGALGGSIAGVERDDEGNIIGFSPERFALGFAGGAAGAKALSKVFQHKATQNHALKQVKILQKEYQALQAYNLPLFAKIMSDIPPQTFIKPTKEAKRLSNDIFNKKLAQVIQNAIDKDSIKELPQVNFKNISEFRGLFDEVKNNIGYLATPMGKIRVNTQYALHHFTNNTYYKDRTNIKGGFFETFKNPLFIVEDDTKGKGSIYFYKPFYDKDKNMLNLFGIGVNQKGIINFKTYYLDEKKSRLKQLLKNEGVRIKYVAKE